MPDCTKLYLDTCCLSRPFDDQSIPRNRLESEAILIIIRLVEAGQFVWIGSDALDLEVHAIPIATKRMRVLEMMRHSSASVKVDQMMLDRAHRLIELGLGAMDAVHLSCAEATHCAVFLTTDDRLLKVAGRPDLALCVPVVNPLAWLSEICP